MKLDYHPPHLMLNHFPSALFPMELVFAAIGFYRQDNTFNYAAFYVLAAGVVIGWVAGLFGIMDLVRIPKEKPVAQKTGFLHGAIHATVLSTYTVLLLLQWKAPEITSATMPVLILKGVLVLLLICGNYLGGQLVLKYKIGTINNNLKQ